MRNTKEATAEKDTYFTDKSDREDFPFYPIGLNFGAFTGLAMGIYLTILQWLAGDPATFLQFGQYLILAVFLGLVLYRYKVRVPKGKTFKRGVRLGMFTSAISALVVSLINILLYVSGTGLSFDKFGYEPANFPALLAISGITIFEILIYGMILTFVWLQLFKERKPAE